MICKFKIQLPIFILLICFAAQTNAQKFLVPDSLSKRIDMPIKDSWKLESDFEIGLRSSYIYTISDTARYYSVFKSYSKDSLSVIDFKKYELLLYIYCPQCLALCHNNIPCHRNACMYKNEWYLGRKNKN